MKQQIMGAHRVRYIDIFRGIGIVLMILGHIGMGDHFDKMVHAFNMPMFFFSSGYFFRKMPICHKIKITLSHC